LAYMEADLEARKEALKNACITSTNPRTRAVKYLGIWLTGDLNWEKALKVAAISFKSKLTKIQNKKLPIGVKTKIINIIINKGLEYTLSVTALEGKPLRELEEAVNKAMKVAMKMNSTVQSEQMYADTDIDGLGVTHVKLVRDAGVIATAIRTYFNCTDDLCKKVSQIRIKDNKFIQEIGWFGLGLQEGLPKQEMNKIMKLKISDDFLTKAIKIMFSRNMRVVGSKTKGLYIKDCARPAAETAIAKLLAKGVTEWMELSQVRTLRTCRELNIKHGTDLSVEEYQAIRKIACTKDTRILKDYIGQVWDHRVKDMEYCPIEMESVEEFTFKEEALCVWTDGAMDISNNRAGFGVFFKKKSPYNYVSRNRGEQTVGSAELEAMEWVVMRAPCVEKIIVFSDSLYAINAVNEIIKGKGVVYNAPNRAVLRRIAGGIKERINEGCSIELIHIYSHVEEKRKQWKRSGTSKLKNMEDKLAGLTARFGTNAWVIEGNNRADKLANIGMGKDLSNDRLLDGLDAYIIVNDKAVPVGDSMRKHLKKEEGKARNVAYIKAMGQGSTIDYTSRVRCIALYSEQDQGIFRKIQCDAMATRLQCHYGMKAYEKEKGVKHRNWERYQVGTCLRCKANIPEDTVHAISECDSNKELHHKKDADLKPILKSVDIDNSQIPWVRGKGTLGTYKDRDPEEQRGRSRGARPGPAAKRKRANSAWTHRGKYMAGLGYLPNSFTEKLHKKGPKTGEYLTQKITKILLDYTIQAYKKRNQEFFEITDRLYSRDGPVGHIT
jgi:ribonuclease HI